MSWATLAWARDARTGSPGRKAVLMTLAEYADEANSCFPSQQLLADATEQSVRTVRSHLAELEAMGLLRREHRGNGAGGRTSDRYYLLVHAANPAGNPTPLPADRVGVTGNPNGGYRQPVAEEQPLLEPPLAEPPTTRAAPATDADGFDAFWHHYPRHTAKGEARKAWPAAVRAAGNVHTIVQGAQRFAADPNRDPAYTPHPATWLRAERWADDPLPPRGQQANGRAPARAMVRRDVASGEVQL